ncbi:MAG: hypothetical protein NTX25_21935 [Proteobacteria bacterium]|nr:hypothetical protein [Pseudomonadota bacterium]
MSKVQVSLLLTIVWGLACEQRKGSLLPSRLESQAKILEVPNDASKKPSLSAKTLPTELQEQEDALNSSSPFKESELQDLETVKQEALSRIKSNPAAMHPEESSSRSRASKLYLRGEQLSAQGKLSEGLDFYLVACQLGYLLGCHRFGWHEEQSGNLANAKQFYRLACEGGINKSCNNLGVQLERHQDWSEALDSYARACLNQHQIGCENLKRLRLQRLKLR